VVILGREEEEQREDYVDEKSMVGKCKPNTEAGKNLMEIYRWRQLCIHITSFYSVSYARVSIRYGTVELTKTPHEYLGLQSYSKAIVPV